MKQTYTVKVARHRRAILLLLAAAVAARAITMREAAPVEGLEVAAAVVEAPAEPAAMGPIPPLVTRHSPRAARAVQALTAA
jgi:hypothetical protein